MEKKLDIPKFGGFYRQISLEEDREYKGSLYARARIPVYWIINLVDSIVEVYTKPKAGKSPGYVRRQDYGIGENVPLVISPTISLSARIW